MVQTGINLVNPRLSNGWYIIESPLQTKIPTDTSLTRLGMNPEMNFILPGAEMSVLELLAVKLAYWIWQ